MTVMLTWCIRAGGRVIIISLLNFPSLRLFFLGLRLHPPSRHEAGRVVGVTERSDDVCDEWFLKFGQLWCCSIHEGADRKPQAGLLITLHTAQAINVILLQAEQMSKHHSFKLWHESKVQRKDWLIIFYSLDFLMLTMNWVFNEILFVMSCFATFSILFIYPIHVYKLTFRVVLPTDLKCH